MKKTREKTIAQGDFDRGMRFLLSESDMFFCMYKMKPTKQSIKEMTERLNIKLLRYFGHGKVHKNNRNR